MNQAPLPRRKSLSASTRRRSRRAVVGAPVRVIPAKARPAVRRAYFDLAKPRVTFNPWKTKRDWKASRPKFLAALLIIVLSVALYQLFDQDIFFVNQVQFSGNRILPTAELDRAVGLTGWNIFFVEPRSVESALRRFPEVKDVQASLSLPNVVQVRIHERVPRFLWQIRGTQYWVDEEGIAMRVRGKYPGLLTLLDADSAPVKLGERVNEDAFNAAVSLRNAWPKGPATFEWTRMHGLGVREEHGWMVYFGSSGQMQDKLAALQVVTAQILKEKRTITFIDLGNGLPYYQEVATVAKSDK